MTEALTVDNLHQQILDSASLVIGLLWQDFEPFPECSIHEFNNNTHNKKVGHVALSGSMRHFYTEDLVTDTGIKVSEVYYRGTYLGEENVTHELDLSFDTCAVYYGFTLNLD